MEKTFIIAEAGVNHNGNIEIAKRMIDTAVDAGADAIKFQTFKAEKIVSKFAPKAEYQEKTITVGESQLEMIKNLQLDMDAHKGLISHCKKRRIIFLSSPFDSESVDLLNELGLEILKIPSGEITNLPLLTKISHLKKKIILSTGMADLGEIEDALNILTDTNIPRESITVLHCHTEYPTAYEDVNLFAMLTIKEAFKVDVGYSDHTLGIEIPIAAAALGATVIEKHFTLDRNMQGPDHKASLEPKELEAMVRAIRNVEKALGSGVKKPSLSELKNRLVTRKSIVALRNIKKGEIFSEKNIIPKRPGTGISPMKWYEVIGKESKKDFNVDELIEI